VKRRKAAKGANLREQRHRPSPDEYDVWHWFARDPQACVADAGAQRVLRGLKHPSRPWFQFPTLQDIIRAGTPEERKRLEKERDDLIKRQREPWWQHLRTELLPVGVPVSLADRFADHLSGYVVVRDREQAKFEEQPVRVVSTKRGYELISPSGRSRQFPGEQKKGRVLPEWRRAKRLVKELAFPPIPTATPPGKQSLKTTLTSLMIREMQRHGASLAEAAETVNSVWALIGEAGDEFDPGSVARADRRARQRRKLGR
jgi:hypothetical protein